MPSASSHGNTVVLVVEDEPIIRMNTAVGLEDEGFIVIEAESADEAVRILEARSDIRIVFTDIHMPGSMDGIKLAAAVRDRWPPIEIVITSGRGAIAASDLPTRGVFIPKPYECGMVAERFRQLMA